MTEVDPTTIIFCSLLAPLALTSLFAHRLQYRALWQMVYVPRRKGSN